MHCKKLLGFLLAVIPVFLVTVSAAAIGSKDLAAASAVLMDYTTGEILLEKNGLERRAPASTTKIMTALVALERGTLKQRITASPKVAQTEGSSIWLKAGETHTLEELLYGVLLNSGNDASLAVAENLAGSERKFAGWMTEKAREIGANDTNFENSNGLPGANHYTTARDLALITRYAMHNSTFAEIVKTKTKTISWPGHNYDRQLINHNKLLWRYSLADGVKTGYTQEAGKCLVSSATKNGHRLIAVVLNSGQMYEDSEKLFNYGFDNYQLLTVVPSKTRLAELKVVDGISREVPVVPNRGVTLVLPRQEADQVSLNLALPAVINAPVERMQQVGELEVKVGDKLVKTVPLVTANTVPREGFWRRFINWVKGLLS